MGKTLSQHYYTAAMRSPNRRSGRPRHADVLTPAEWEVLAGVRDGLQNAEIARRRGCNLETVRWHIKNIRFKLGLHSRAALRAWPGRPLEQLEQRERPPGWQIREQIPLIAVRHMGRALQFYSLLGFEVVSRHPDPPGDPGWAALGAGAARLMVHAGHHRRDHLTLRPGGSITLSLYVQGLDAVHGALSAAGMRPTNIELMPYGAREFYVNDPDGHELALVEFPASDPGYALGKTQTAGQNIQARRENHD